MEPSSIREHFYALAAVFGFICTVWAVCIPTIRTIPNSHKGFYYAAYTVAACCGLVLVLGANVISADRPAAEVSLPLAAYALSLAVALSTAAVGAIETLRHLSEQRT